MSNMITENIMSSDSKTDNDDESQRTLGKCEICSKVLIEYSSHGIYAYNCHLRKSEQIVFLHKFKVDPDNTAEKIPMYVYVDHVRT